MISQDTVGKILDATRVEDVVGDFVTLKRRGANYLACCPFHNEKTPSFTVSPSKGFYYCFGCKKGGSAVTFLMDHENLSYVDALKYLAQKYHIEVEDKEETAEEIASRQRSESLLLVSEYAARFFSSNLKTPEGHALGYNYFRNRGLEDSTIEKFGLGWCPSDRYALLNSAREAGYKEEYLVDTGLCIRTEEGKVYDRFHDRAIFPIYSVSGRIIAFGGRTLRTDKIVAKYVNSPETEIYVKNKSLYGIWFAKNQIAKEDKCILVEGYLDVISMHQLGITNVVASSGTSLTIEQIRLIKRFTENVTIIYDGDWAGIHAALRGIGLVLAEGLNVKIVLLPDGKDPDDFSHSHTQEEFRDFILENEQDFIAFKSDLLLKEAGDDPLKKANLINDIADTIALIPDPVKRSVYTESCSTKFSIDRNILQSRVNRTLEKAREDEARRQEREEAREAAGLQPRPETPVPVQKKSRTEMVPEDSVLAPLEKGLLDFILNNGRDEMRFTEDSPYYSNPPVTVADFIDSSLSADETVFSNEVYRVLYDEYFALYDEGLSQEEIIRRLLSNENRNIVVATVALTVKQYEITEKNLRASLTNSSTLLLLEVPRTIVLYQVKILDTKLEQAKEKLKDTSCNLENVLMEISELNRLRVRLNNKLGRI